MGHDLQHTIALLGRTPAALDALLSDLPETWTLRNEGENTRSALDIVGHLIHGERRDWMPRARTILQFGETQAFGPFDRWAQVRESQDKSLAQLLDEFSTGRPWVRGAPSLGCCSAPDTALLSELCRYVESRHSDAEHLMCHRDV
jgi:hypothetical protein